MSNSRLYFCTLLLVMVSCLPGRADNQPKLKTGIWRATLLRDGQPLPFLLEIQERSKANGYTVFILNGAERLEMDSTYIKNDSLHLPMALFESEIVVKPTPGKLVGNYIRNHLGKAVGSLPFEAVYGEHYLFFKENASPETIQVNGKWATLFINPKTGDSTQAVGTFEQNGNKVKGSFLTSTGDYRFLNGEVKGDSLFLSTFDASNAFLFKAALLKDGTLQGAFWSGLKGYKTWTARRDAAAQLPDAGKLTYLKPGYESISFSFPDKNGKRWSLQDSRFKNKVVIVQLLGSWCPNCMDETKFLAPWYQKNRSRGIEIVGLAFERSEDLSVSAPKLQQMAQRYAIDYPILLAGTNSKESLSKALPMLNHIISFPTTVFLDKNGKTRYIHTGFSGPGTGHYYDAFVEEFNQMIDKLLSE